MRFSIVTISFNQAPFLEATLRSVLEQDHLDIEYIVVDPGSTDGSREIIERYRDRLGQVIYQPDNGAAQGLNHGFAHATGEVFGFVNSDDILLPGAISRAALEFERDPVLDVVAGHAHIIDADGRWLRHSYADPFEERAFAYQACTICQQSTFFRADLFRRTAGFNEANRIAWDAELIVDLMRKAHGYRLIDAHLSAFRLHADAITGGATMTPDLEDFTRRQFARLMGREWRAQDQLARLAMLARKYARNPRALWQRLRYGSIYGRFSKRAG